MKSSVKKRCVWLCTVVIVVLFFSSDKLLAYGWVAPKEAAKTTSPIPSTQSSIDNGKATFGQFCAGCHGIDGKGLSAATTKFEEAPPNLIAGLAHQSEGDFHWKIKNGNGGMPSFEEVLSDKEVWDLINYIKSGK